MSNINHSRIIEAPDFFWEQPPEAADYISTYSTLSDYQVSASEHADHPYYETVKEARRNQPPERVRQFCESLITLLADEGETVMPNTQSQAHIRRLALEAEAQNGHLLRVELSRWLRAELGEDWTGPRKQLSFEQQLRRDRHARERGLRSDEVLAEVRVFTDDMSMGEWTRVRGSDGWPCFAKAQLRTAEVSLSGVYAGFRHHASLSVPATVGRITALEAYVGELAAHE